MVFSGCDTTWHHVGMTEPTEEQKQKARDRLGALSTDFADAEKQLEAARKALGEGIVDVLMARTLGPSEVTKLVPYERQQVGRIAKAAGVPPLREATVVSKKQAAGGSASG